MSDNAVQRRLAAILAADVVGYSRLMGEDETGTLTRLRRLRTELIEPLLAEHSGRLVKLMGDGFLVEFPSVVAAVSCAVSIQRHVAERTLDSDDRERLQLRIGINVGDIIIEGDDIYGDGVNIASRLEGLAEPGGICVSQNVYEQIRDKLSFHFSDLGEREVKNIARPVRVFQVLSSKDGAPAVSAEHRRPPRWVLIAATLVLLLALGVGGAWWWLQGLAGGGGGKEPSVAEAPVIAVLPFDNLSDDSAQDYFANGLSEDLITDLSKLRGLTVIARNSSFAFKGKQLDVREIGEKLGVRFLIEGSVRKAGDRLRVNAQLIDAVSGNHLWAERWDRPSGDIFAVQDELTSKIVETLEVKLSEGEQARRWRGQTKDTRAYDLYLQGRALRLTFSEQDVVSALPLIEEALTRDPGFAAAWVELGWLYWSHVWLGMTDDIESYKQKSLDATNRAIAADPDFGDPHMLLAEIALYEEDFGKASQQAEIAVELYPGNADNLIILAYYTSESSRTEEALKLTQRAFRLNPLPPPYYYSIRGIVLTSLNRFDEADEAFGHCLELAPEYVSCYRYRTAMHLEANDIEAAREAAREVLRVFPNYSISKHEFWHKQTTDPAERQRRIDLLKSAGLPE
ncbi:adenylate/guanylate cyclase domain-containing protein [Ruegeria hyattellae]|uniref:adenylate/guanylate cyclase domain-containing protein n=1 Tax=Ruegeria hyattellae TaxID=3233337 RepID=UPI00355C811A